MSSGGFSNYRLLEKVCIVNSEIVTSKKSNMTCFRDEVDCQHFRDEVEYQYFSEHFRDEVEIPS